MAQSVNLWGATYSDVPAIEVPKSGGGMASFTDVTDTTAIASDVLSGKYFYTAAGEKTLGTGSGGGGVTVTDEANATGTTCVITSGGSSTPSETWETLWDANTKFNSESNDSYAYITEFGNIHITQGSVWRVTWDNTVRVHTAVYGEPWTGAGDQWHINSTTDGTNGVYAMVSNHNGYWLFVDSNDFSEHYLYVKLERAVTS